ncbi:TusE/DsrC/DsvC family sulfur relay protein [Puniceicoccales bacterium CK1056]|uniref:TusE/DsrC/DsvC family sulfur relay protein n=1 Tax=Oceanipulchritudo coccoides TaxID=2706888 RepID=A0A6B2M057_9BACT|nr:TusE/DsrC/DsvC family sulfur relay protein [Oceanipulchritudo coccoides]NDV61792.1 TusE/DsrC/DsvC family sulfur relay protein [Oceanipulchritudo coccoides]
MATKELAGSSVEVNEEGYLTDRTQWNEAVAAALATEEGIELSDEHWKVLKFIESDFAEKQAVPGMRRLNKVGGIPTKDLYRLFPGGPIKKAARIAGFPKPASCV